MCSRCGRERTHLRRQLVRHEATARRMLRRSERPARGGERACVRRACRKARVHALRSTSRGTPWWRGGRGLLGSHGRRAGRPPGRNFRCWQLRRPVLRRRRWRRRCRRCRRCRRRRRRRRRGHSRRRGHCCGWHRGGRHSAAVHEDKGRRHWRSGPGRRHNEDNGWAGCQIRHRRGGRHWLEDVGLHRGTGVGGSR